MSIEAHTSYREAEARGGDVTESKRHVAYYCRNCGWYQSEPCQWAMKPECPECRKGLTFLRWNPETEQHLADYILDHATEAPGWGHTHSEVRLWAERGIEKSRVAK